MPIHALKEFMGHAKIQTTQEFYLAVETANADTARSIWDNHPTAPALHTGSRDEQSVLESVPGTFGRNAHVAQNDTTPAIAGVGSSEADGTRTRNHRIDSPGL